MYYILFYIFMFVTLYVAYKTFAPDFKEFIGLRKPNRYQLTQADLPTNLAKAMKVAFAGDLEKPPPCLRSAEYHR